MPGTSTFDDAQLQIVSTDINGEHVRVHLSDGLTAAIPLHFLYRLNADYPVAADAELLVLPELPEIEHVLVSDTALVTYLKDGRILSVPLAKAPPPSNAG